MSSHFDLLQTRAAASVRLAILTLLVGCTGDPSPDTRTDPASETDAPDTAEPSGTDDTAPETVDDTAAGEVEVEVVPGVEPIFTVPHALVTEPFSLELHHPLADGVLRYTLDGSAPEGPAAQDYTDPLWIEHTTVVRAAIVDESTGRVLLDGGAQTWIFLDQVKDQQRPGGWPEQWWVDDATGPWGADYEIDPELTETPEDIQALRESLDAMAIIAVTLPPDSLFGEAGIYENPELDGPDWERAGWFEFFEVGGATETTFKGGYRIHGGAGRKPERSPKKSFRLACRGTYEGDLRFPVFGEDSAEAFDTLVLRAGYNRTWVHYQQTGRTRAMYTRERFTTDLHRQMGHLAVRVRPVHVFLNGLYWGMYQMEERPDAHFWAGRLDRPADEFDVLNSGVLADGEIDAWTELFVRARRDLAGDAELDAVAELLDLPAFADYMLLNHYLGNIDWPRKNYWVGRHRAEDGPFRFFIWDAELIQSRTTDNIIDAADEGSPGELFQSLRASPEFRLLVADRAQAHFFGDGVLQEDSVRAMWVAAAEVVRPGMPAESARWGDHWRDVRDDGGDRYQLDPHWLEEHARVRDYWIDRRQAIFFDQLTDAGLWPTTPAATLTPAGGVLEPGAGVQVDAPVGVALCTEDGTDPRQRGGGIAATAVDCSGGITPAPPATLQVRVLADGVWSPLVKAEYSAAR